MEWFEVINLKVFTILKNWTQIMHLKLYSNDHLINFIARKIYHKYLYRFFWTYSICIPIIYPVKHAKLLEYFKTSTLPTYYPLYIWYNQLVNLFGDYICGFLFFFSHFLTTRLTLTVKRSIKTAQQQQQSLKYYANNMFFINKKTCTLRHSEGLHCGTRGMRYKKCG